MKYHSTKIALFFLFIIFLSSNIFAQRITKKTIDEMPQDEIVQYILKHQQEGLPARRPWKKLKRREVKLHPLMPIPIMKSGGSDTPYLQHGFVRHALNKLNDIDQIKQLAAKSNTAIRYCIAEKLGKSQDPKYYDFLLKLAEDDNEDVQEMAASFITDEKVMKKWIYSPKSMLKARAITVLMENGKLSEKEQIKIAAENKTVYNFHLLRFPVSEEVLVLAARNENFTVRMMVFVNLKYDNPKHKPIIHKFVLDKNPIIYRSAIDLITDEKVLVKILQLDKYKKDASIHLSIFNRIKDITTLSKIVEYTHEGLHKDLMAVSLAHQFKLLKDPEKYQKGDSSLIDRMCTARLSDDIKNMEKLAVDKSIAVKITLLNRLNFDNADQKKIIIKLLYDENMRISESAVLRITDKHVLKTISESPHIKAKAKAAQLLRNFKE